MLPGWAMLSQCFFVLEPFVRDMSASTLRLPPSLYLAEQRGKEHMLLIIG